MLHHAGAVSRTVSRARFGTDRKEPSYRFPMPMVIGTGAPPGCLPASPFVAKNHFSWDVAGDCLEPVHRDFYGKPWRDQAVSVHIKPQWLEIKTRCRKCRKCMWHRERLWRGRALGELRRSCSTGEDVWFVTLTQRAEQRTLMKMEARKCFNDGGKAPASANSSGPFTDWDELPAAEQFSLIHQRISERITLWLKRLRMVPIVKWRDMRRQVKTAAEKGGRKPSEVREVVHQWTCEHPKPKPARFRYLLVTEAHQETEVYPHYHLLVHVLEGTLGERDFRGHWRSREGFCEATRVHFGEKQLRYRNGRARLVRGQPEDWLYLCKYLSKSALARVRASQRYGSITTLSEPSGGTSPSVKANSPSEKTEQLLSEACSTEIYSPELGNRLSVVGVRAALKSPCPDLHEDFRNASLSGSPLSSWGQLQHAPRVSVVAGADVAADLRVGAGSGVVVVGCEVNIRRDAGPRDEPEPWFECLRGFGPSEDPG